MSSEPARWLDSAEPTELLSLMRVGADELAPPDVLARIGERLRASALVSETPVVMQPSSRHPLVSTTRVWVKAAAAAVLVVVVGLGLYLTLRSRPDAPQPVKTSPAQQTALPPQAERIATSPTPEELATHDPLPADTRAASVSRPDKTDAARRPQKTRAQPHALPGSPAVSPIETRLLEARLLEQARKELSARPDHALVLLAEHAARFPTSWLEEERAALSIRALVATGQRSPARVQLTQFEARFPGSLHTPRLERALAEP